jgi:hypothetical protein
MPFRVDWYLAIQILSIGITRERHMKPPSPDLYGWHLPLSNPMERYLPMLALTRAW